MSGDEFRRGLPEKGWARVGNGSSLFDRAIERACEDAFAKSIAPGGWLRERLRLYVGWTVWGFAPGFGLKERESFTETVANRIYERARKRVKFLGARLWRVPYSEEWCAEEAERIVTEWLKDERIKFGDDRYDWTDGHELADEDMSYWEAA